MPSPARRTAREDASDDPCPQDTEPDPLEWAREVALRMLTGSAKTRSQLAEGLRRRDCPVEVIDVVLDRLEDVGLVDDARFATDFVHQQQARGLSGRALTQKLRAKGVDADTALAAVEDLDPMVEEEAARALIEKRLRSMHGLERIVQTRRLAGMLARKGYGSELSMRLIQEALDAAPEHRRD